MGKSYLPLIFLVVVCIHGCRPSTTDAVSSSGGNDSLSQSPTPRDTSTLDTTATTLPMQGEIGSSGDFMIAAAEVSLTEVKLSELALERSVTPKVKEFAQMMLKDHNTTNSELKKLAEKKSVEIPSSLCMECEAKYNALAKRKGAEFDSIYMHLMAKDHKAVLEKFLFQSTRGGDVEIKKWAAEKIPTLQQHLNAAETWQRPDETEQ